MTSESAMQSTTGSYRPGTGKIASLKTEWHNKLQPPFGTSNGGSGGDGMDIKITKLEASVAGIEKEVNHIRKYGMWLVGIIIASSVIGYHSLNDKLYSLTGSVAEVKSDVGHIKNDVAELNVSASKVNEKLDVMSSDLKELSFELRSVSARVR